MKRIALFGLTAVGAAGLLASSLFAAESDAAKPTPSPAAEAPAKKEGPEGKKWGHRDRGPGEFRHGRGPERFGDRRGPEGFGRRGGAEGFGRHGGPGGLDRMLNLTDDQKAKVKEIMEANRPKIEAIRKEEQAKIKAIMDESMKQLEPLLTADQKQVLTDMQKLRQSREKLDQDKKGE